MLNGENQTKTTGEAKDTKRIFKVETQTDNATQNNPKILKDTKRNIINPILSNTNTTENQG